MPKPTPVKDLSPRSKMRHAAPRLIEVRARDVRKFLAKLEGSIGREAVHDLRVAVRRLRASLRLLGRGGRLEREAKQLQDALGEVRDLHVRLVWLARTEVDQGADGGQVTHLAPAVEVCRRRLPGRVRALRRALKRWREAGEPRVAKAVRKAHRKGRLGGHRMRHALGRKIAQVDRRIEGLAPAFSAEGAHRLRLAVKKLRYQTELLEEGFPELAPRLLEALRPLQDALGALHDGDVRLGWLREDSVVGHMSKEQVDRIRTLTLGERRRQAAELDRSLDAWHEQDWLAQLEERKGAQRETDTSSRRRKTLRNKGVSRSRSHSSRSTGTRARTRSRTTPGLAWAERSRTG
jgi:CHAD domain-containing protein